MPKIAFAVLQFQGGQCCTGRPELRDSPFCQKSGSISFRHINFEKDCKFDCEKKARHLLTRFNFLNPSMGGPNRLCKLSLCQSKLRTFEKDVL